MARESEATAKETGLLVGLVRILLNWNKARLASRTGIGKARITKYEAGLIRPEVATMEKILAVARLPLRFPGRVLPWLREILAAAVPDSEEPPEFAGAEGLAVRLGRFVTAVARPLLPRLRAQLRSAPAATSQRSVPEREKEQALKLVALLVGLKPPDRRVLVEGLPEVRTVRVCRGLCDASEEAAADDAEGALDLAHHAVRLAELAPGDERARAWRKGFAMGILGNAKRVAGDLNEADREMTQARRLRQAGPAGEGKEGRAETTGEAALFPEARLLDLVASLRRDQRRWSEAFALLDEAYELSPPGEPKARVLLKKAITYEQHGEPEQALASLRQAAGHLTEDSDPNLLFAIRFNYSGCLCDLGGRFAEAEALLGGLRERAARLGSALHQIRVRWLEGRIHLGLGRREEGIAALTEVQAAFIERNMAYDVALVTLELAVVHAEQGESRQVKALVALARPVFEAQRVHREALACFRLLQDATEREALTAAIARRLLDRLRES